MASISSELFQSNLKNSHGDRCHGGKNYLDPPPPPPLPLPLPQPHIDIGGGGSIVADYDFAPAA
ncbi:hypothetical protein Csa_019940 [Cucumis sativus]|uniref:Uncharacterized protein n=1 Tax=Cucumis sativus TaxID=3659 RepID=A0A0A0LUD7_CUCSA|nr:hypothetical protein Csa_019940 [Cucumis sativus]